MGVFRVWTLRVSLLFSPPFPPPQAQLPPLFMISFQEVWNAPRALPDPCPCPHPAQLQFIICSQSLLEDIWTNTKSEQPALNTVAIWIFSTISMIYLKIFQMMGGQNVLQCPQICSLQQPCVDYHMVTISPFCLLSWYKSSCSCNNPSGLFVVCRGVNYPVRKG